MTALIESWAAFVISARKYIIAGAILLLPIAFFTGGTIPTDNSSERYFVEGDPALEDYDRLIELFGDNEYLVVGFEATDQVEDIFNPDTLRALKLISDFLDSHRHITQLRSLTTYEYIIADGDDLSTDYLIDDVEELIADPSALARAKEILNQEELALDTLITRDFRHTRISARIEHVEDSSSHKVALVQELFSFIENQNLNSNYYNLHLSGYVLAQERLETFAANDISSLVPIMALLMSAILYISFRSIAATLLPWIVIVVGAIIVLEAQYYLGYTHTTIDSSALSPTLIIIGMGMTIHVLLEFFQALQKKNSGINSAHDMILKIWKPAFYTAITTAAGFIALSTTRIAPIREFALLGAVGSLLLFIFALTLLPSFLCYLNRVSDSTNYVLQNGLITKLTQRVPEFTYQNRDSILLIGFAALIFAVWNIPSINVDTNYVTIFKANSQTRQDIYYFDNTYRGMMTLDIIIDSGTSDGLKDPNFLVKIDELQSWLESRSNLGPTNSIVDYLKEINMAMNGDNTDYYRVPESDEMSAQFLLLFESSGANDDLSDIKDFYQRYTRLVAPVINMPALDMKNELDAIIFYLSENLTEYEAIVTGTMVLKTQQDLYVVQGIARSFIIALTVITVFFIILFRSVKYGILSIVPSVIPIVFAASTASWLGINLDLSAVIVFAMTMGIAVDDAIHVMSRYLLARENGDSTKSAIKRAMNESGRAVVISSIVLVSGFGILGFGTITTVIYLGLFGAIIMSLALLGDLLFLPAILYLVDGTDEEQTVTTVSDK